MFNIKALRIKKGINQSELAVQLAVTLRTIQHWEKGTKNITIDKLDRINNYFGLNMNLYQENEEDIKLLSLQEPESDYSFDSKAKISELEKKIENQDKELKLYKKQIKILKSNLPKNKPKK